MSAEEAEVKLEEKDNNVSKHLQEDKALSWPMTIALVFGALFALYVFLVGLTLMGDAFKVLGGKDAGRLFDVADNPIAGLMTGILSTVLVQSSSTSTSVVVAMVGADQLSVSNGIPIIMGANIGTSVTNSIVSMAHVQDRIEYQRAFSGATVHDMFNMLTVSVFLPMEVIFGAMEGEGGPLYWLSYVFAESATNGNKGEPLFTSPIKTITKPVANGILKSNKYVIYALTLGKPEAVTPASVNTTLCASDRRLAASSEEGQFSEVEQDEVEHEDEEEDAEEEAEVSHGTRALLNRRLDDDAPDCSEYYCVGKGLDKNFKKISKKSYKKLTKCKDLILDDDGEPCGKDKCYLDAGEYYDKKVTDGRLVKGGFLEGAGDLGAGIIGLIMSLILLSGGLICLCLSLKKVFMSTARRLIKYAIQCNDYLAIVIGLGITLIVQSSSVCTSALTPLAGIGVLPLEKMLAMSLGANIGTTCTALIASLVSLKFGAIQIALVHLFFNIFGVLLWFPIPPLRRIPLALSRILGIYASYFKSFPPIYICTAFLITPGILLGVSECVKANIAGGVVLILFLLAWIAVFAFAWLRGLPIQKPPLFDGTPLCYKVLSKEQRDQATDDLAKANEAVVAISDAHESS
jgi:sodium-dependent phosphate cotransporter